MASNIEKCPHCGGSILKGAMKCPSCSKLLTTAEQQQEAIIKHQETSKTTNIRAVIVKLIIATILIVLGFKYYEEITELIRELTK